MTSQGSYIQEEAQPRTNQEQGNNKDGDNSVLSIARRAGNNSEGGNNSKPIRGELKHKETSLWITT